MDVIQLTGEGFIPHCLWHQTKCQTHLILQENGWEILNVWKLDSAKHIIFHMLYIHAEQVFVFCKKKMLNKWSFK